jgi:two-component system, LytTR family, response regulator
MTVFVRSNYELIRIELDEIEYVESFENYIKIHFTKAKLIMCLIPLKTFFEKLPSDKFIRIHRRFIVSIDKVKKVAKKRVRLTNTELPAGAGYFKSLKALIKY